MHRKTVAEAAELIDLVYSGRLRFAAANSEPGAQAYLTPERDLVIPGTNEQSDWSQYNLRVHGKPGQRIPGLKLVPLSDIRAWHFGFLAHADSIYRFAFHHRPRFIVGHSLGGAAAQIIGYRLQVPTITFGAPRVYRGGRQRRRGEGWVLNLCRSDDPVVGVPPFTIFRHIGSTRRLNTGSPVSWRNHPIVEYARLLAEEAGEQFARIEKAWPRAA